ncbi:MAG: RNA 2',3'-cyclic phosphodiesterase [Phycisphaerales bacterium]|nr:RNA 2',3'-cyclic phosphodiesterase [Phycisphaerales bacterium]
MRTGTMRLFIAIYPPPDAVHAMLSSLDRLDVPPFRVVPDGQVHLTVHFVGPVRAGDVAGVAESLEKAASGLGGFELRPTKLVALPVRDPRLLAIETTLPAPLAELQRRLVTRLAAEPSGRAYLPHITVCRFRSSGPREFGGQTLDIPAFSVTEVCLMRSVLRPEGAEHRVVERVSLS